MSKVFSIVISNVKLFAQIFSALKIDFETLHIIISPGFREVKIVNDVNTVYDEKGNVVDESKKKDFPSLKISGIGLSNTAFFSTSLLMNEFNYYACTKDTSICISTSEMHAFLKLIGTNKEIELYMIENTGLVNLKCIDGEVTKLSNIALIDKKIIPMPNKMNYSGIIKISTKWFKDELTKMSHIVANNGHIEITLTKKTIDFKCYSESKSGNITSCRLCDSYDDKDKIFYLKSKNISDDYIVSAGFPLKGLMLLSKCKELNDCIDLHFGVNNDNLTMPLAIKYSIMSNSNIILLISPVIKKK